MKILVTDYSFNASAKTVTFNRYSTISLESVLVITNVTDNIIIYNFADPTLGGTVLNNVLTLTYDTTSMSNTDNIQIYYDDPAIQPANASNQSKIEEAVDAINYLASQLQWLGQTKAYTGTTGSQVQLRALIDTNSNINQVLSLSDTTRLNNFGSSSTTAFGSTGRGPLDATLLIQYQAATAAALSTINNIVIT